MRPWKLVLPGVAIVLIGAVLAQLLVGEGGAPVFIFGAGIGVLIEQVIRGVEETRNG